MNKVPNRQAICEVLMEQAKEDKDIVVLCSDSRGSASLAPFAKEFPGQFVEAGIAEQNLVGIGAGLAKCGKKVFAASPASFVSTRSYEQAKVDCAYSDTNDQCRRKTFDCKGGCGVCAGYFSAVRAGRGRRSRWLPSRWFWQYGCLTLSGKAEPLTSRRFVGWNQSKGACFIIYGAGLLFLFLCAGENLL